MGIHMVCGALSFITEICGAGRGPMVIAGFGRSSRVDGHWCKNSYGIVGCCGAPHVGCIQSIFLGGGPFLEGLFALPTPSPSSGYPGESVQRVRHLCCGGEAPSLAPL